MPIPVDSTGIGHIPVESGIRWNFVVRLHKIKMQCIPDFTGIHSIVHGHRKRKERDTKHTTQNTFECDKFVWHRQKGMHRLFLPSLLKETLPDNGR
jgi:hypothetical protein